MSPKRKSTRPVTEQEALAYLRKAEEFHLTMVEAFEKRRWDSVGLAGVHCAISATDAVLGRKVRVRSSGESHHEAVDLLKQHVHDPGLGTQCQRLSRILSAKNLVEYESREFHEAEAAEMVKNVARYLEWAKGFFPI